MKFKIRKFYRAVLTELTENKSTFFVYMGLRLLVVAVLILQAVHRNYENGFLCAAIGFSLVDIMNRQSRLKFDMSPLFMAITAFCFSMTIGVLWEFFEFGMDYIWGLDMQKDTVIHSIHSTMLDPENKNHCVEIADIQDVVIHGESMGLGGYLDIGLIDTMCDLMVNFLGAVIFSVMGYFYIKRRDSKSFVKGFVPEPWTKEKSSGS